MPNKKYEKRKRRVELHQMRKIIEECNYLMRKDDLWRGRFEAHIVDREPYFYKDKSGMCSNYFVVIIDNAERKVLEGEWIYHHKTFGSDFNFIHNRPKTVFLDIMYLFNDAIVHCSNAWVSKTKPYELAKLPEYDFTKKGSYHMPMEEIIKQIRSRG